MVAPLGSGLTRAYRVEDCPAYLGAELDTAPAFECQRAARKKRRFLPISHFRSDTGRGGGMMAAVEVENELEQQRRAVELLGAQPMGLSVPRSRRPGQRLGVESPT